MIPTESKTQGFDPSHFVKLARLEQGNFWFRARNKLILWSLARFASDARNFLEVGCGTGFVLQAVACQFPRTEIHGSELLEEGLVFAAERLPRAQLSVLDVKQLCGMNSYDAIGAFDVLEHIDDDVLALSNLFRALRPGGKLFINVPQHEFLWSYSDEIACHERRYERADLFKKLQQEGFKTIFATSFVALPLPLMLASRMRQKRANDKLSVLTELEIRGPLNFALEQILNVEIALVRLGVRWPFGGSLFIVAEKPVETARPS